MQHTQEPCLDEICIGHLIESEDHDKFVYNCSYCKVDEYNHLCPGYVGVKRQEVGVDDI